MADLLGTGISGLLASRVALDTTGHNIANVNTPGYSRESVQLQARNPQPAGSYFIGTGVDVVGVQRAYSQYLTTALWNQDSSLQRATTFSQLTDNLNNLLGGSNNLQTALDSFYGGIQDAANDPSSPATRQALLGKAASLVATFHTLDQQLGQQSTQVNQGIADSVANINSLAGSIAGLNQQIEKAATTGNAPNDLLDQRDELVQQLSKIVKVTTSAQGNSINVFAGNGQTLVTGGTTQTLKAVASPYDSTLLEVVTSTGADVTGQLSGGSLGGLLDFRGSVLDPARNQLGRAAIAFGSAINTQHHQGMDLNGQLGGDMFSLPAPQALPATGNSGSASVAVSVGDLSQLKATDYTLGYAGGAWSLKTSGGTAVPMSGSGTAADPFVADGLQLVVNGSAADGDSFDLQPTRGAAGGIQLALTDPNQLALAAPVKVSTATGNQATAGALQVESPNGIANPALLDTVAIQFTDATTYTINGSGSYTFTPGSPIELNGWSLQLDGTPQAGDSFTVKANTDGAGDNSNALALGGTANLGVLDGGTASAGDAYASLIADAGTVGAQAKVNLDTQTSLHQQAEQSQQSLSGVNLDEEASNLVRFQQSYQASAQVISTANAIFNTLINAVRS